MTIGKVLKAAGSLVRFLDQEAHQAFNMFFDEQLSSLSKSRQKYCSSLIDPGLPSAYFHDVVESHGQFIDFVKFGWGTSLVTRDLRMKIDLLKGNDIPFGFGGSLFEKAFQSGLIEDYRRWCAELDCPVVEISNGTIDITRAEKASLIASFARDFEVFSEVGYKDSVRSGNMPSSKWVEFIESDLAAGARHVIIEARESGTSGVCRSNGEIRVDLIEDMLGAGIDHHQLIFEAPNKALQVYFIKRFGSRVILANIPFSDLIALETLRLGLHADTLTIS